MGHTLLGIILGPLKPTHSLSEIPSILPQLNLHSLLLYPKIPLPLFTFNMTANDTAAGAAPSQATIVATEVKTSPVPTPAAPTHPLGPISATEITQSAKLLEASWPEGTDIHYKGITLFEPSKAELAPYLVAERAGEKPAPIDRRSFIIYYIRGTVSTSFVQQHIEGLASNKLTRQTSMRPLST